MIGGDPVREIQKGLRHGAGAYLQTWYRKHVLLRPLPCDHLRTVASSMVQLTKPERVCHRGRRLNTCQLWVSSTVVALCFGTLKGGA